MTKIEWADVTWNPVTGCTKISDGCKNCVMEQASWHTFFVLTKRAERMAKSGMKCRR